jgi:ATP-dependent DNA helicase DinG
MDEWFRTDGLLARAVPGYEARGGQVELAQGLADALEMAEHFLGEAGTGSGKSLAYLAALKAAGVQALIVTYTKALQDQLMEKDVPIMQQLFPDFTAAVLKGRRNYLCLLEYNQLLRLAAQSPQEELFGDPHADDQFRLLRAWLHSGEGQAALGDLDALPFALSPELKADVTIDGQSCLGRACDYYGECYAQRAKQAAVEADVVIANHRLLLLDMALAALTDGETTILPPRTVVVLDEAQHLEDVATESFGQEITAGMLIALEKRLHRLAKELRRRREREMIAAELGRGVERPGPSLETIERLEERASVLRQAGEQWGAALLAALGEKKAQTLRLLLTPALAAQGAGLGQLCLGLASEAYEMAGRLSAGGAEAQLQEGERWRKAGDLAVRFEGWLRLALEEPRQEDPPMVRYVEREAARWGERAVVHVRPIRVAGLLHDLLWDTRQVLAVSATLATGDRRLGGDPFAYWKQRVGVTQALQRVIPSPFPFATRVVLYVPQAAQGFVPPPFTAPPEVQEAYRAGLAAEMAALLRRRRGGAFVLCTSFAGLKEAYRRLQAQVEGRVLVQGDVPTAELVRQFRAAGDGVLLGTRTFWEGVDVPGNDLTMVIIDRLPFAVPDDPLWQAKVLEAGDGWFRELALPQTMMQLKQAFGRLMRRMDDWGVVACLDGRLRRQAYGSWLLSGLPPAPVIGTHAEVEAFTARMQPGAQHR